MTTSAAAEVERVMQHFERATRVVKRNDTSSLPRLRRLVRGLLLDELGRYQRAGRFPRNRTHPTMTPVFIDAEGTRCAIAHLMELGGAADLVQRIGRTRNFARVRELADMPEFVAWLEAAGLTVEEAARIQPSYCSSAAECVCSTVDVASVRRDPRDGTRSDSIGVLETQAVAPYGLQPGFPAYRARIVAVYGRAPGVQAGDDVAVFADVDEGVAIGDVTLLVPVFEVDGKLNVVPIDPAQSEPCRGAACFDAESDAGPERPVYPWAIALDHGAIACQPLREMPKGFAESYPLSAEQGASALLSSDCQRYLKSLSLEWTDSSHCDPPNGAVVRGCGAGGPEPSASSVSIAILVALVSIVVSRRARMQK